VNVKDTIPPVALCQDITVYLDKFGQAYVLQTDVNPGNDRASVPDWAKTFNDLEGGSYDNCGIVEMFLDKQLFTSADTGKNNVILSVYDPSRNMDFCNAVVTVVDTVSSVLEPVENIVLTVAPGVCTTQITYPAIKIKGSQNVTLERIAGLGADGNFPLGSTLETWKATDQLGKVSYTSFTVNIKTYNAPPAMNGIADIAVDEDAAGFEIPISGIGYGNDCAVQQILSLDVVNSNESLCTVTKEYVDGAASGKLQVALKPDQNGEATVTLTLKDNGGTANGGTDTTVKTFKITVKSVNDLPTVQPIADQYITLPGSLSVNVASAFSDKDAGDVLTFTVTKSDGTALPAWMSFSTSTGLLTGTPAIANIGVTEVKVIAKDNSGATVQDIFLVVVFDPNAVTLNVTAVKGATQLTGGFNVTLFVKNGTMFVPVVNTPVFVAGTYTFYNLPLGTYLAKAEITDAILNPGLMNTYYESATSVTGAVQINITTAGTRAVQIKMVASTIVAGECKIMGTVVRKTGTPELITQGHDPVSTPAAGVDMVLKQNGVVVANTVTGSDGKYSFTGLPAGVYDVYVEVVGYTQTINQLVELTVASPVKDKVDFTIWTSADTHIITKIVQVDNPFNAILYPNPTTGKVNIDLTWNDIRKVDVTVYNILGVPVFRNQYMAGDRITFDMSGNVTGIFMVKIAAEGRTIVKKLTLDRK